MLAQSVQGAHGDLLDAIPKLISIMLTASNALQVSVSILHAALTRSVIYGIMYFNHFAEFKHPV